VVFVVAQFAAYGCYTLRIERQPIAVDSCQIIYLHWNDPRLTQLARFPDECATPPESHDSSRPGITL
jgi:hypothetical protein